MPIVIHRPIYRSQIAGQFGTDWPWPVHARFAGEIGPRPAPEAQPGSGLRSGPRPKIGPGLHVEYRCLRNKRIPVSAKYTF